MEMDLEHQSALVCGIVHVFSLFLINYTKKLIWMNVLKGTSSRLVGQHLIT